MKKVLIFFTILSLTVLNSNAQEVNLKRVEIEAKVSSDNYEIAPVGDRGVIVFSESKEKDNSSKVKSQVWSVTLYDVDFKEKWSRDISIAKNLSLGQYRTKDGYLYLSFDETGSKKNQFQLLKINLDEGHTNILTGESPNASMKSFSVSGGNVFYGGFTTLSNKQKMSRLMVSYCACFIPAFFGYLNPSSNPLLYYADFSKGTIQGVHPKKKECLAIADISTLKSGDTEVLIGLKGDKKNKIEGLKSKIYDSNGQFKREYKIKSKSNNILSTGYVSSNEDKRFIIGTYKKELDKNTKKQFKIYGKGKDNGVYFTSFDSRGKQKMIKFYDFTKFNGFEDYADWVSKKKAKKKKKVLIGYNLLVHEPIYRENEMTIVSEAYYAEYHTEYYYTTDSKGNSVRQSRQVFDGYRTTHALIASFDLDGALLWSSTFPINTLSYTLKKRIRVLPGENETTLAFSHGGSIYSKSIKGDEVIDVSETKVETKFGADKVKKNYKSDMDYWYDEYYIAYGYQKIKNDKKRNKSSAANKRKVFYFNKISVN